MMFSTHRIYKTVNISSNFWIYCLGFGEWVVFLHRRVSYGKGVTNSQADGTQTYEKTVINIFPRPTTFRRVNRARV